MRGAQLVLLSCIFSVSIFAWDLQDVDCSDGSCRLNLDPHQDAFKQQDEIVIASDNNITAVAFSNITSTYEYSYGNKGTTTEIQQTTVGIDEEGKEIVTNSFILLSKGNYQIDYESTMMLYTVAEIIREESVIVFIQKGSGQYIETVGNFTESSNVSFTGTGTIMKLSEAINTLSSERTMIIEHASHITKNIKYTDMTEEYGEDRSYRNGTDIVLVDVLNSQHSPPQVRGPSSSQTSVTYSETPLPGQDGPIIESTTGTYHSEEGEEFSFVTVGEGYCEWNSWGDSEGEFEAALWKNVLSTRDLWKVSHSYRG